LVRTDWDRVVELLRRRSDGLQLVRQHHWYLVPLTIPVTILACYANWVSLKFFRHN